MQSANYIVNGPMAVRTGIPAGKWYPIDMLNTIPSELFKKGLRVSERTLPAIYDAFMRWMQRYGDVTVTAFLYVTVRTGADEIKEQLHGLFAIYCSKLPDHKTHEFIDWVDKFGTAVLLKNFPDITTLPSPFNTNVIFNIGWGLFWDDFIASKHGFIVFDASILTPEIQACYPLAHWLTKIDGPSCCVFTV